MYKNLLSLMMFTAVVAACSSTKHSNISMIKQGITGYVYEVKGNQMPMIGEEPPKPKGVATAVYIYEATNINQVQRLGVSTFYTAIYTKQIGLIQSDSTGHFSIELPVGNYSLFVKIGEKYYANRFNEKNDINLYKVEDSKVTDGRITINYAAAY